MKSEIEIAGEDFVGSHGVFLDDGLNILRDNLRLSLRKVLMSLGG